MVKGCDNWSIVVSVTMDEGVGTKQAPGQIPGWQGFHFYLILNNRKMCICQRPDKWACPVSGEKRRLEKKRPETDQVNI